ncbi:hypothetical protein MMC13_005201 [Lambiella insularis]|nr:hypothetical protein [Lambiella insularis]
MASDEDYSAFLDQANQDTGASNTSTQSASAQLKATDTDVPAVLQSVDQYYTSEADEPFEPVSLVWKGRVMPSENDFAELIGHKAEVSTLSDQEFDPKNEYGDVFKAVEKSGDGKARVFRVEVGRSRVWYYVVGMDAKGGKVVGLRAKAVES